MCMTVMGGAIRGRCRSGRYTNGGEGWVSGGFMVLEPDVLSYVDGDGSSLEADVLERISEQGRLGAFRHEGFWQSMDTIRDVRYLRGLWADGSAPWRTWE